MDTVCIYFVGGDSLVCRGNLDNIARWMRGETLYTSDELFRDNTGKELEVNRNFVMYVKKWR